MKTYRFISFTLLALMAAVFTGCKYNAPSEESLIYNEEQVQSLIADGHLYTLQDFVREFMSEEGNYLSDTALYRTRANDNSKNPGIYLFSIDTIREDGPGIYIRGRVATDDWGGNFYKSLVIQQMVNGQQQALRLSVDAGSISGLYPRGQEILIRCNGFAIGRYANQVQLCVPSYNNNVYADRYREKIGWAPGRIPFARFKAATHLIGKPDASLLHYDTKTIPEITASYAIEPARQEDGKLVIIENVHYTGYCLASNKDPMPCTFGDPTTDKDANVFAPTTGNVGYPQSRLVMDKDGKYICVSMSEYAKQAHFYLPGAESPYLHNVFPFDSVQKDVPAAGVHYLSATTVNNITYYVRLSAEKEEEGWVMDDVFLTNEEGTTGFVFDGSTWTNSVGILHCPEYSGSVRGVLSYYMDNAGYAPAATNWAISICDLSDLNMYKADGTPWEPMEYFGAY